MNYATDYDQTVFFDTVIFINYKYINIIPLSVLALWLV